jgi:hypothetical protein
MRIPPRLITYAIFGSSVLLGATIALSAQSRHRTSDEGHDVDGMWLNNTATPLERPKNFADHAFFTEAEAREFETHYLNDKAQAANVDNPFELIVAADPDVFEWGRVLPNRRTSLLVDPTDGRVPPLTPQAQRLAADKAQHVKDHYADNPEDLKIGERCLLVGGNAVGPPMLPVFYNNNVQIVQARDYVVIVNEMIHDARIIPLTRATHLPAEIRQWKGDSIGRWDGNTLVVDTTNFTDKTTFRGSGSTLHVIERFARRDAQTLSYEFTIDDPASFVRPWSAQSEMTKTYARMFEYACHEGNYSMTGILRGARASDDKR